MATEGFADDGTMTNDLVQFVLERGDRRFEQEETPGNRAIMPRLYLGNLI
jgi:hypothetical protein